MTDKSWNRISMQGSTSSVSPSFLGAVFIVAMGYAIYTEMETGGLCAVLLPSGIICLIMTTVAFFRIFGQSENIAVALDRAWVWHRWLMYLKIAEVLVIAVISMRLIVSAGAGAESSYPRVIGYILIPVIVAFSAFVAMIRIAASPDTDDAQMSFAVGSCRGQPQIATLWFVCVMYLAATVIICLFYAIGWPTGMTSIVVALNSAHVLLSALGCAIQLNGSSMFGGHVSTEYGNGIMTWTVQTRKSRVIREQMRIGPSKEIFDGTNIDLTITKQNLTIIGNGKIVSGEEEYWYISNNGRLDDNAAAAINTLTEYAGQHSANVFTQSAAE